MALPPPLQGEAPAEGAAADGDGEECEVQETDDGEQQTGDDISDILAIGGEDKKCKKKDTTAAADAAPGDGNTAEEEGESGADALAAAVGAATCDKDGMDEKVAKCLGGLEAKVREQMMLERGIC